MSSRKTILKAVFAFLNAFFMFCAAVFFTLYVLSLKETVISIAEESGYNEKSVAEAEKQMNVIALAGGFGNGFFDGILMQNDSENNLEIFVNSAFEDEIYNAENSGIKEKINNKIFAFAESKMHGFSLETRGILEETVKLCADETKKAFYPDIMRHFCAFLGRFNPLFLGAAAVFTVLFLTSCFLLLKRDKSALKTSLFSAFLMCGTGPIFLMFWLNKINLGFSHLWLKDFFNFYLSFGLAFLTVLSLIILIFALRIKKRPVSK